jgi:hypothetical protein
MTQPPTEFTLEPDVALKISPSSDRGKKEYQTRLNKLAKQGWADRAALKKNHKAVIAHIETLYPDDEKGRQNKRFYVFAIFWAMDEKYLTKKNKFWQYLQKINPLVNIATGEAWLSKKKYDEKLATEKSSEED